MRTPPLLIATAAIAALIGGVTTAVATTSEPDTRIIGGQNSAQAYPWMVSLQKWSYMKDEWSSFCGGALIAPTWVLTAQHCTWDEDPAKDKARIGSLDRTKGGDLIQVKRFVVPSSKDDDIALVELAEPSKQTTIGVAAGVGAVGTPTLIMGWGAVKPNPFNPGDTKVLKELNTSVLADSACAPKPGEDKPFRPGKEICTDSPGNKEGSCYGDSGGPQVRKHHNGQWILIGDTSRGPEICAKGPSTYTSVPAYLSWIQQITGVRPVPGSENAPAPSQPAPQPSQPAPQPTQPAPQPTQPAPWPSQPAPQPTQPAPWPTQPAPQPSQPAPQPTQPGPKPTRPRPTWPGMPGIPGQH